jgi:hypothetical protein
MGHVVIVWNARELCGTCDNRMGHAGVVWTCGNRIEHVGFM